MVTPFQQVWGRIVSPRLLKFGTIGLSVMIIGGLVLHTLVQMGVGKELAYFIQALVSIELNFFLNNQITWNNRRENSFLYRWGAFHVSRLITVPLNQLLFILLATILGINYLIAYVMVIGFMTAINYIAAEFFVFRKKETS